MDGAHSRTDRHVILHVTSEYVGAHNFYLYFKTYFLGVVTSIPAGQQKNRGLIPERGKQFICSPKLPDLLYCPHHPLYNGYRGFFTRGKAVEV
jgi:hypothetical protein